MARKLKADAFSIETGALQGLGFLDLGFRLETQEIHPREI
jgi:hypothetical protein